MSFLNPLPSAREFERTAEKLADILSESEEIVLKEADRRQMQIRIKDFKIFKRRLVFLNISIAREDD